LSDLAGLVLVVDDGCEPDSMNGQSP
jgi:hypothetical protein